MGYLVIRIEPKENETKKQADCEPHVAHLATRHALRNPSPAEWKALGAKHGYEIEGVLYGRRQAGWPYTAYIYTSRNRDGVGRCGSTLHRVPARRV